MITVYGVPGWGSAISELMLTLAEIPYHFVNVEGFDKPGPQRDSLMQINPLCQVPTFKLADGSVMSESAAMALTILDQRPDLAPEPGTPQRHRFQHLLIWLVANVYPTFTYADYPERWTADAPQQLRENCVNYRRSTCGWSSSLPLRPMRWARRSACWTVISRLCVAGGRGGNGSKRTRRNLSPSRMPYIDVLSWNRCCGATS